MQSNLPNVAFVGKLYFLPKFIPDHPPKTNLSDSQCSFGKIAQRAVTAGLCDDVASLIFTEVMVQRDATARQIAIAMSCPEYC